MSGFERSMPRQRQPVTRSKCRPVRRRRGGSSRPHSQSKRRAQSAKRCSFAQQGEIADPHDRVLQMGRDHREVLLVERDEPQKFHDATPAFVIVRLR